MITVFTPTFNRAETLEKLYKSLIAQSSYEFEWLVIDDGSTDGTNEVMFNFINNNNPFRIRYYRQENGGKHRAINRGVNLAVGDAFFIVDSDDYLLGDAIERISEWWKSIVDRDDFAGVSGLKVKESGHKIGDVPIFEEYVDATNLDRRQYGLCGDKSEVYKTEVLKRYPFPEFEGENFITEAVVWDRIAYDGKKIRWYNYPTYVCEYRDDGLTHKGQSIFVHNPKGWGLYIRQNRLFGKVTQDEDIVIKRNYCIEMSCIAEKSEIMQNLGIAEEEYSLIMKYISNTEKNIGKNIAIYGLGARGQYILRLYFNTTIKVKYVIDLNKRSNDYQQYNPCDELPKVDTIIVTPKNGMEEIVSQLKKNTSNRILRYEEWKLMAGV
jgi:glycosyltransferase involved in cell wall biosynthesis